MTEGNSIAPLRLHDVGLYRRVVPRILFHSWSGSRLKFFCFPVLKKLAQFYSKVDSTRKCMIFESAVRLCIVASTSCSYALKVARTDLRIFVNHCRYFSKIRLRGEMCIANLLLDSLFILSKTCSLGRHQRV